jgi:DNA-binding CsgD family transcriptional regulator
VVGGEMWVTALVRSFAEATTFVDVSAAICEHARATLDVHQTAVTRLTLEQRPRMSVDDIPFGATDAQRLEYLARWPIDPQLAQLLAEHAAVGDDGDFRRINEWCRRHGYSGPRMHVRLLPLVEPSGLLGTIRCGTVGAISKGQRRDLNVLAAYASARLVRLGVSTAETANHDLTPAQHRVARLAADGLRNADIADTLEISIDTVKKHLKDAFATLSVRTRTELAALLAQRGPRDTRQPGVTRHREIWVTTLGTRTGNRRGDRSSMQWAGRPEDGSGDADRHVSPCPAHR